MSTVTAAAARRHTQEESIYSWAGLTASAAAPAAAAPAAAAPPRAAASRSSAGGGVPRIKTHHVGAPPAAPPRRMHEDSSQVESVLKPVRGIRDAQRRAGVTPTNHSRHNIHAVKEQSRLNALHKQAAAHGDAAGVDDAGRRRTLRRSSSSSSSGGGGAAAAAAAPGSFCCDGGRNFVEENKAAAAAAAAKRPVKAEARAEAAPGAYMTKSEYGQVPAYLLERKLQLAEAHEARLAAKAAAAIPPGLRQMPEAERLETLALLQQNRTEVEAQLAGLPLRIETHSMKRHKEELERRAAEIEAARRIFARPGVLVQADAR